MPTELPTFDIPRGKLTTMPLRCTFYRVLPCEVCGKSYEESGLEMICCGVARRAEEIPDPNEPVPIIVNEAKPDAPA